MTPRRKTRLYYTAATVAATTVVAHLGPFLGVPLNITLFFLFLAAGTGIHFLLKGD